MDINEAIRGQDMKASRMLVELDTLFDTRLAVLSTYGPEILSKVITSNYYERTSDSFKGVDYDDYKLRYSKRDRSILRNAHITPIADIAKEFALSTLDNVNNSPFHFKPVLLINIHPYKLNEIEIANIINGVRIITGGICDIEAVDLSHEQLTPLYLKLNLAMMAIYDYDKWLEVHSLSGAWKKHTAPDVAVIAPRISMTNNDLPLAKLGEAFSSMQEHAAPFIDLKLLPINFFNIVLKPEHFANARK